MDLSGPGIDVKLKEKKERKRQHKRYFTDYRNQNKSSQKVGVVGEGGDTIPHQ
jgi:hypothetical protein